MKSDEAVNFNFAMPDGSELGLHVSRFDERQRRMRLTLPKSANCWDYAPLSAMATTPKSPNHFAQGSKPRDLQTDMTGSFLQVKVPVIWIGAMPPLRTIPLYGTAPAQIWFQKGNMGVQEVAAPMKVIPAKAIYV